MHSFITDCSPRSRLLVANRYLPWAVALPLLVHLLAMYVPGVRDVLGLQPLLWREWQVWLRLAVDVCACPRMCAPV